MADKRKFATKDAETWTDEGAYWQSGALFLERDGSDILLTDSRGSYNRIFRMPVAVLREMMPENARCQSCHTRWRDHEREGCLAWHGQVPDVDLGEVT